MVVFIGQDWAIIILVVWTQIYKNMMNWNELKSTLNNQEHICIFWCILLFPGVVKRIKAIVATDGIFIFYKKFCFYIECIWSIYMAQIKVWQADPLFCVEFFLVPGFKAAIFQAPNLMKLKYSRTLFSIKQNPAWSIKFEAWKVIVKILWLHLLLPVKI